MAISEQEKMSILFSTNELEIRKLRYSKLKEFLDSIVPDAEYLYTYGELLEATRLAIIEEIERINKS